MASTFTHVWKRKVINSDAIMYWSSFAGRQLMEKPSDQRGYDGSLFILECEDGNTYRVKGPWSSSPDVVRKFCDPEYKECSRISLWDSTGDWETEKSISSRRQHSI